MYLSQRYGLHFPYHLSTFDILGMRKRRLPFPRRGPALFHVAGRVVKRIVASMHPKKRREHEKGGQNRGHCHAKSRKRRAAGQNRGYCHDSVGTSGHFCEPEAPKWTREALFRAKSQLRRLDDGQNRGHCHDSTPIWGQKVRGSLENRDSAGISGQVPAYKAGSADRYMALPGRACS